MAEATDYLSCDASNSRLAWTDCQPSANDLKHRPLARAPSTPALSGS